MRIQEEIFAKEKLIWLLSVGCCIVAMLALEYISFPWFDEIGTSDTAINLYNGNGWHSNVWPYSYNFLHLFCLRGWVRIFGVSHRAICSMNLIFAGLAIGIVALNLHKLKIFPLGSTIILVALLWFSPDISSNFANGRIDGLCFLLSAVIFFALWRVVFDDVCRMCHKGLIIFVSCLFLFLCAVYTIPLIVIFYGMALFFTIVFSSNRKVRVFECLKYGGLCAAAIILGLIACAIYQFHHHQLFRYLNTYISFNANLGGSVAPLSDRVLGAYTMCMFSNFTYFLALCLAILNRRIFHKKVFVLFLFVCLIPLFMVLAGRFAFYYRWIYAVPVVICFVYSLDWNNRRRYQVSQMLMLIVCFAVFACQWVDKVSLNCDRLVCRNRIETVLDSGLLGDIRGADVLLMSPMINKEGTEVAQIPCYYPLVRQGAKVDMVTLEEQALIPPKEKFSAFIARYVHSSKVRSDILAVFDKYEHKQPLIPERPLALVAYGACPSEERLKTLLDPDMIFHQVCADEDLLLWVWLIEKRA